MDSTPDDPRGPTPASLLAPDGASPPTVPLEVVSLADPALDRAHLWWPELSARYARTRHPDDLIALPRLLGARPTRWTLRAVSVAARALILSAPTVAQQQLLALRFSLAAVSDETGARLLPVIPQSAPPQVADATIESEILAVWGGVVLDELGDVALHRLDLQPRSFVPFPRPPRSVLPA